VARAKWDAWHALSNKHSHEEAQMLYVDLVRKFVDLQEE
jgi:acyl-CoA-binding protein